MEIREEMILKYNQAGPRYTSYPPAVHFNDAYNNKKYLTDIQLSNFWQPSNLSFYFHVPFCPRLCHFCGCNSHMCIDPDYISRYMDAVLKEMDTILPLIDHSRKITQIHWGGGTPNSISYDHICRVMEKLHDHFEFSEIAEVAIECNPAYLEYDHLEILNNLGFNRISLGIQDLNPEVLKTINRQPSKYPVSELVQAIRENDFKGINIDLIYGLPGQTVKSFCSTVQSIAEMRPDRLVTFSYAHVPWVKQAQKILEKKGLPGPLEKLTMLSQSLDFLKSTGYLPIGMDHYALPQDNLAKARKEGALHRNFQGYCTRETTGQVIAFGASSISQLEFSYSQNIKNVSKYIEIVGKEGVAIERGYKLNIHEHAIRASINQLMCNGLLDFSKMAENLQMTSGDLKSILQFNLNKFSSLIIDGLVKVNEEKIGVTEAGMALVRVIAMQIDPMISEENPAYSKVI